MGAVSKGQPGHQGLQETARPTGLQGGQDPRGLKPKDEAFSLSNYLHWDCFSDSDNIQPRKLIRPKDPKDPKGPNEVQGSQGRGRAVLSLSQPCSFRFSCSSSHWRAALTQATPPLLFLQTTWRSRGGWPICAPCECCWQHLQ